jgi:Protein of unknown function (DUF4256)
VWILWKTAKNAVSHRIHTHHLFFQEKNDKETAISLRQSSTESDHGQSPKGRRSVCYDREALEARKEHKPKNSATDMAAAMGIEILTEAQYRELQTLGDFDTKTSSWVKTPPDIRARGGAIFCDRRYDHVFTYHNGAESYYAARAFRGALKV